MLTDRAIIGPAEANASSSSARPSPFFFPDLQLWIQPEQLKILMLSMVESSLWPIQQHKGRVCLSTAPPDRQSQLFSKEYGLKAY